MVNREKAPLVWKERKEMTPAELDGWVANGGMFIPQSSDPTPDVPPPMSPERRAYLLSLAVPQLRPASRAAGILRNPVGITGEWYATNRLRQQIYQAPVDSAELPEQKVLRLVKQREAALDKIARAQLWLWFMIISGVVEAVYVLYWVHQYDNFNAAITFICFTVTVFTCELKSYSCKRCKREAESLAKQIIEVPGF